MTNQKGVALIVALIMLLIVTLLGTVVMRGASLDMKMANNGQERQQAFNAAEAALSEAESSLVAMTISDSDLTGTCSGEHCFNSDCTNGYCFFGSYEGETKSQGNCSPDPVSGELKQPWNDAEIWKTETRYIKTTAFKAGDGSAVEARYIVEFRCFIDGDQGTIANNGGDMLFRISARGVSAAGNAEVMLQSTFRRSITNN